MRFCTTARAARCGTRCATGFWSWACADRDHRRRSRPLGVRQRGARRVRPHGGAGLSRRDRRGGRAEVPRFARNSRDWQQLIEMCRVVDTVLVDQEAVYAPRQSNDRLLLGLEGLAERVRARPAAAAFAGGAPREGQARRVDRRRPGRPREERRSSGEGPGPASAGGDCAGLRQGRGAGQRPPGRCCGFSNTDSTCLPSVRTAGSFGAGAASANHGLGSAKSI